MFLHSSIQIETAIENSTEIQLAIFVATNGCVHVALSLFEPLL